jgi:hypothetical protein
MSNSPLLDYIEEQARVARDAGIAQVQSNNPDWFALAMIELQEIAKHGSRDWANIDTFTGETIRQMISPLVGHPASPNAWGALIMAAIKKKMIEPTGQYVAMKAERSHARKTAVYRFVSGTQ